MHDSLEDSRKKRLLTPDPAKDTERSQDLCTLRTQRLSSDLALETSHYLMSTLVTCVREAYNSDPVVCVHVGEWSHTHRHTYAYASMRTCTYSTHSRSYIYCLSIIASISLYCFDYMPFSTIRLSSPWGQGPYVVHLGLCRIYTELCIEEVLKNAPGLDKLIYFSVNFKRLTN